MTESMLHGPGNGRVDGHRAEAAAVEALHAAVGQRLADAADDGDLSPQARAATVDELITAALDDYARQALRASRAPLDPDAEARVRRVLRDAFVGLGGLQPLLENEEWETINIDGCDNVFGVRRDGSKVPLGPVAASDEELIAMLRGLGAEAARRSGQERRFDHGEPELSIQLPGGERLFALMDVVDRVSVSIRLHPLKRITLTDLVGKGEMTAGMAALFTAMVRARLNIVVSGGPAVGKTTLLRALARAIPADERVWTIEDAYELSLSRTDHADLVRAQSREPNIEGAGGYDMSRLLRASLRMAPDRVIVGEVRGAEVVQMAKAMSIGIDGSMGTVHASSSRSALAKLVTYAMEPPALYPRQAAMALVGGAVHVVIHLAKVTDGTRVVSSVREVVDFDGEQIVSNEVYRPGSDRRAVPATGLRADTLDQLAAVGFDPAVLDRDGW